MVTEFLVVAATLLDLKAARLLPDGEVEDNADIDLLEAQDLLFARLAGLPRLPAGHRAVPELRGRCPAALPAGGDPRGSLSRAAARGADRSGRRMSFRRAGRRGLRAQATAAAGVARSHPLLAGVGRPAHRRDERAARVLARTGHVRRTDRRVHADDGGGGPFPRAAEPLPDAAVAVRPDRNRWALLTVRWTGDARPRAADSPRGIRAALLPRFGTTTTRQ